ncbi:hypothetical protein GCM10011414_21430 [Croceivirga lutea]|uniref:hypothetical protein n=1 Tax=Croceivirga lutea TaxID=1775167 RepID=UPI0016398EF2|nr:hypothetical protein [Croceivirga lutea]GGG51556.1 hypothetical protein GCM10011414_21430 [Croceivirga lutea]
MKNFKSTLGFLSLLLFVTSCQEKPKENTAGEEENTPPTAEVMAPKQLISLDKADELFKNYKQRRAESIMKFETEMQEAGDKAFVPTQFVTFDINVMKDYIAFVEQEAKKGGTTVDSLRIYLGNYGDLEKGWKKKRRNTVFVVPAAKAEGGYGGIYIGDNGKALLMSNFFKKEEDDEPKSEASFIPNFNSFLYGNGSLILNDANNHPPPYGDF